MENTNIDKCEYVCIANGMKPQTGPIRLKGIKVQVNRLLLAKHDSRNKSRVSETNSFLNHYGTKRALLHKNKRLNEGTTYYNNLPAFVITHMSTRLILCGPRVHGFSGPMRAHRLANITLSH